MQAHLWNVRSIMSMVHRRVREIETERKFVLQVLTVNCCNTELKMASFH
jgi:hypothetical protein